MKNGANNSTAERIKELRKNIDLTDIPEIKDFSGGHLRNWKPAKKPIAFRIDLDNLQGLGVCECTSVSATPVNWVMDRILGKL